MFELFFFILFLCWLAIHTHTHHIPSTFSFPSFFFQIILQLYDSPSDLPIETQQQNDLDSTANGNFTIMQQRAVKVYWISTKLIY